MFNFNTISFMYLHSISMRVDILMDSILVITYLLCRSEHEI